MRIGVVIGWYGDQKWQRLADERARPSVGDQADFTIVYQGPTLATARNLGAEWAIENGCDWLCFLDADDQIEHGYLDAMRVAHAEIPPVAGSFGPPIFVPNVRYVSEGTPEHDTLEAKNLNDGRPLLEVNHVVVGALVPAWLFEQVGGFSEEPFYEDWALWLRCERAGARFVDVPAAVYRAYINRRGRNRPRARIRERTYWEIRRAEERARASEA